MAKKGGKAKATATASAAGAASTKRRSQVRAAAKDPQEEDTTTIPALLQFHPQRRSLRARPLYEELIFAIPSFLSRAECVRVRAFADALGFERVTQRATRDMAFRDNGRILRRLPGFAACLWARMQRLVPAEYEGMRAVGLNPAIRFYRYERGQRFGCHVDESDVDPVTGHHSRFTVLVYLNDAADSDLAGGDTVFYGSDDITAPAAARVVLRVAPETGAALVHGHGDRCLLHEGALVTAGAKYLLRTDVMYAPTD